MKNVADTTPLFTLTVKDFDWSYTKGSGSGGQKRNKTSSAVHCMHRPSGAHGYAEDSRSQHDNKKTAFVRLTESKEFQTWLRTETMKRSGQATQIEEAVAREMQRIKVEIQQDGKWVEVDRDVQLKENDDEE